jgi:O-antigen/teichoic acid export membrane protein
MGLGVGVAIPCVLTNAILRGMHRFDLVNLISTSGLLLSAALTVIMLLLGGNIIGLVVVNICVTLLMQVPSIGMIRRIAPELRLGWRGANRGVARQIISFSWSLFVVDLATRLQTKTDEIVIGVMLPLSVLTPYALARKLSETAQLLTEQFLKLLLPLASELHAQDDKPRLRRLYLTSTRLSLVLFVPVGLILVILAGPILTVWVGAQYAAYSPLVAILTCASLIVTSQWAAVSILQGMARHRLSETPGSTMSSIDAYHFLRSLFLSISVFRASRGKPKTNNRVVAAYPSRANTCRIYGLAASSDVSVK